MRVTLLFMLVSLTLLTACDRQGEPKPPSEDSGKEDVLPKVPDFPAGYRPEKEDKLRYELSPTSAELLEGDTLKLTVRVTNLGPRPLRPWLAIDPKQAGSKPLGKHVLYPGKVKSFDVTLPSAFFADGQNELVLWAHTDAPQAGQSTYDFPVEGKPAIVHFKAKVERLPKPYVEP